MGFTLNQLEQERQIRKLQKKEDKDTKDYEQLTHLPKINNVELKGNKTGGDLGLASAADIATVFSEDTNYTAGCYVYYEGTLYRFNADHSAGAWDPTDAVVANVTDEIVSNAATIAGLTASDVAYGTGSVEDALGELSDKFVLDTYTLSYDSASNLRVTGITPPTGCSLERMIILPPNYDAVAVKVANIFRISTTGIVAVGSGFVTTDTLLLSVLYFKN